MKFKAHEQFLWPIPIWECFVDDIDNKSIVNYCHKVREEKPGVIISNRGGWHSNEIIFPLPFTLEQLFDNLVDFVNDIPYDYMGIPKLKLGNWWININSKHDYNTPHHHQHSILSGVYYVSVPDSNMGDLILHRGDSAEFFIDPKIQHKPTTINSLEHPLSIKESMFYLFPSWVKHSVEKNKSDKERISIAFNFVPSI